MRAWKVTQKSPRIAQCSLIWMASRIVIKPTWENLSYAFASINLQITEGEFVTVVGPYVRTTLLNTMVGLLRSVTGRVLLNIEGQIRGWADIRAVPRPRGARTSILLAWRDTEANFRLPLEIAGRGATEMMRVKELIVLVGRLFLLLFGKFPRRV